MEIHSQETKKLKETEKVQDVQTICQSQTYYFICLNISTSPSFQSLEVLGHQRKTSTCGKSAVSNMEILHYLSLPTKEDTKVILVWNVMASCIVYYKDKQALEKRNQ